MKENTDVLNAWAKRGRDQKSDFMLVICDTFDYEQYPKFAMASTLEAVAKAVDGNNMQRVEGCYDLRQPGLVLSLAWLPV